MRLWHKDLIHCLPRKQLLGQWRECCLIAKNIKEKGTPNHILVNKIMDYPIEHFIIYSCKIMEEMSNRKYKYDSDSFSRYIKWARCSKYSCILSYLQLMESYKTKEIFNNWHNDRYYRQCYYNLQEKYDCGGITEDEWSKIKEAEIAYNEL